MNDNAMKKPGDRIPQTTFKVRRDGDWETWGSSQIFDGVLAKKSYRE